jgi:hypothetical protein
MPGPLRGRGHYNLSSLNLLIQHSHSFLHEVLFVGKNSGKLIASPLRVVLTKSFFVHGRFFLVCFPCLLDENSIATMTRWRLNWFGANCDQTGSNPFSRQRKEFPRRKAPFKT